MQSSVLDLLKPGLSTKLVARCCMWLAFAHTCSHAAEVSNPSWICLQLVQSHLVAAYTWDILMVLVGLQAHSVEYPL